MQSGFYSMLSAQAVPTVALGCWHLGHSHQAWPALQDCHVPAVCTVLLTRPAAVPRHWRQSGGAGARDTFAQLHWR